MTKAKGSELIFISRVKRDGSGTERLTQTLLENDIFMDEVFELKQLSIKDQTYIAHGLSTYVVRLKVIVNEQKWTLDL